MTDVSDLTVTLEIRQIWTWPSLGRALVVGAINGEERIMEFDL
ncbi:hypothetical protein [Natrinema sp. CGMCC1.2065]